MKERSLRKRLERGRREELLDGVMLIAGTQGLQDIKMAHVARDLHCSVATLYKLAPTKVDLVALALERWGERTLAEAESRSREPSSASDRARTYYRVGAEKTRELSHEFRRDMERFAATRQTWRVISDGFIGRFSQLLAEAAEAGEIRPVNATFLAGMLRYIAYAVRDEDLLDRAGLTAREALLEMDTIIWDGVRRDSPEREAG
jgi:AcrR family transcriptional regulator